MRSALLVPILLSASVLLPACGPPVRKSMASRSESFTDDNTLQVPMSKSPSGSADFNFCTTPPEDAVMNLNNAAWLAYFSANEYSHMHYLASSLDELGFQTPDGSGLDWAECAVDLRVMRGFEKQEGKDLKAAHSSGKEALLEYLTPLAGKDAETPWGECARRWFSESGFDGSTYPAPSFENYLIHTAHEGNYLEFFSGGEFLLEGTAFAQGSTQVFFARHKTLPIVVISFRGTETKWQDIATDGKAWRTKLSGEGWSNWGSVHAGFHSAFESISEILHTKLAEYDGTDVKIWITGHSLGGALATLMAADILRLNSLESNLDLRGVYTFGSPRVGNNAFYDRFTEQAASAKTRVVRFRNGDDAVTHIPGLLEYKHVGTLAHIGEGTLEFPEKDPSYSGAGGIGKAADHSMTGWDADNKAIPGYYRRIRDLLKDHPAGSPYNTCQ